jgi:hypothetical protein
MGSFALALLNAFFQKDFRRRVFPFLSETASNSRRIATFAWISGRHSLLSRGRQPVLNRARVRYHLLCGVYQTDFRIMAHILI